MIVAWRHQRIDLRPKKAKMSAPKAAVQTAWRRVVSASIIEGESSDSNQLRQEMNAVPANSPSAHRAPMAENSTIPPWIFARELPRKGPYSFRANFSIIVRQVFRPDDHRPL